jgi:hypothetical protein
MGNYDNPVMPTHNTSGCRYRIGTAIEIHTDFAMVRGYVTASSRACPDACAMRHPHRYLQYLINEYIH